MARYSFIVPAYNEETLLKSSLEAIHACAAMLKGGYEIVVANDASTDRTAEIAAACGARVVNVSCRQIAATRNRGAAAASGEVFVFVDADTWVTIEALAAMERLLESGCVGGGARLKFDRAPAFWGRVAAAVFLWLYFAVGLAAGGFLFCTRKAFDAAGGFDERFFASEEVHFSRALKRVGRFKIAREEVITSARKFRMKKPREFLALILNNVRKGKKAWQQRDGLDIWYDGTREK